MGNLIPKAVKYIRSVTKSFTPIKLLDVMIKRKIVNSVHAFVSPLVESPFSVNSLCVGVWVYRVNKVEIVVHHHVPVER